MAKYRLMPKPPLVFVGRSLLLALANQLVDLWREPERSGLGVILARGFWACGSAENDKRGRQLEVNVTLHGILRDYLPRKAKGKTTLRLPEGATVADVVERLKIRQTITAAVDGVQVEAGYVLRDGDDLQMFRMIGGG